MRGVCPASCRSMLAWWSALPISGTRTRSGQWWSLIPPSPNAENLRLTSIFFCSFATDGEIIKTVLQSFGEPLDTPPGVRGQSPSLSLLNTSCE